MIADHTSSGWKAAALLVAGMALSTAGVAYATITSDDDEATLATEKAQAAAKLDAMVTTGEDAEAEDARVAGGYHQEEHGAQDKKKRSAKREATDKDRDIDKLYELVRQARAELQALRVQAGIHGEYGKERGEHAEGRRDGRAEHGEGHREGRGEHSKGQREGRGEHGERRGERGESRKDEEGGRRLGRHETWNETRNGARLILAYNPTTQSFQGTVQNITSKRLSQVRVEVHLSNGVELGPTMRTDLGPGEKISVELSAANQKFIWWTTHPEHASEEGHGPGHEGGERGEHGEGDGSRPTDPALRPLYNELQLLRHEIRMLARDLRDRKR